MSRQFFFSFKPELNNQIKDYFVVRNLFQFSFLFKMKFCSEKAEKSINVLYRVVCVLCGMVYVWCLYVSSDKRLTF